MVLAASQHSRAMRTCAPRYGGSMSFFFRKADEIPTTDTALPGRDTPIPVVARHLVLDTPIVPPFPEGLERIVVGMGCFWGAERFV